MKHAESRIQIQEELLLAKQSRVEGNEGRARVCARRAAGAAAQAYLRYHHQPTSPKDVFQSLKSLKKVVNLPDRVLLAIYRLTQRVDEDHQLPAEIDLIAEAIILIEFLGVNDPK
jgi:hypothetical protein